MRSLTPISSLLFILCTIFPFGMPFSLLPSKLAARRASLFAAAGIGALEDIPLIPREILFGNPKYASPTLSPDGKFLAYLAPSEENVLNVFCRDTFDRSTSRQVTNDTSRDIRSYMWAEDSKTILFMQDFEGHENFHVWAVDITETNSTARDLTPGENVKASSLMTNKRFPNEILVGTNERDSSQFDMYRCKLETGELVLDTQNPGNVVGWASEDTSFQFRMATVRNQADSSNTIRVRDSPEGDWRDLVAFPFEEEGGFVDFLPDGDAGYITSTIDRDTKALLKVDLKTGETLEVVSENEKCDVRGITLDQDTKKVRAVTFNYARTERVFFDKELEADYKVLESIMPEGAEVGVASRTRDEKLWVVAFSPSDSPSEYLLYDQVTKMTMPLFVTKPELLNYEATSNDGGRQDQSSGWS